MAGSVRRGPAPGQQAPLKRCQTITRPHTRVGLEREERLATRYRFGDFEVRVDERQVLAAGRPLELGGRAFDVLLCLLEGRARVVGKTELMQRAWPGTVVGDNNLTTQVANLRRVLGPTAVVTVTGRGYQFGLQAFEPAVEAQAVTNGVHDHAAPYEEPSIAVLPLLDLTGASEDDRFVDGITEDIITELSRFHSLLVVARNSTFTYKGRAVDVRVVARDLGVRYVLEGSVRRSGNRVRLTAQLIDAPRGVHVWAERYDRPLNDIFATQEDLTRRIVLAIAPAIASSEARRVRLRPANANAYHLAVRAHEQLRQGWRAVDLTSIESGLGLAREALALDADSTAALGAVALAQWLRVFLRATDARDAALDDGLLAADRLIALDPADAAGPMSKGRILTELGRVEEALVCSRRSVELNPNDPTALEGLVLAEMYAGNVEQTIALANQLLRVSPLDPMRWSFKQFLCIGHFFARNYALSVELAQAAVTETPSLPVSHLFLAIGRVALGDLDRARRAIAAVRQLAPQYLASRLAGDVQFRNPEHRLRYVTFLRIAAGMEEMSAARALR